MNKSEKEVIKAALENIFQGSERKEKEDVGAYRIRMETSAKNGCHTIMSLVESDDSNKPVIMNTLVFLQKNGMLDEDWDIHEITGRMKAHKFSGD